MLLSLVRSRRVSMVSAAATIVVLSMVVMPVGAQPARPAGASRPSNLPRTADGHPNLQGIWQAHSRAQYDLVDHGPSFGILPGKGVAGNEIPYLPAALAKRSQNFNTRAKSDPLNKCFFPGVPRIMYLDHPFQIFQTPENVAMTFEWTSVYRLIYTAKPMKHPTEAWMGNSQGHWDGDTLVVEVTDHNDKTWFDAAGDYHSDALKVTERYTMTDLNTIQYQATIEDPKTFSKPWTISLPFTRETSYDRLMEYQCEAEAEEANGDFERDPKTWYPAPGAPFTKPAPLAAVPPLADPKPTGTIARMPDGKPNLNGYYDSNAGGANYGLEKHARDFLTPQTRGVIIDPADGSLPYQPWARQERLARDQPQRGYDDPTAHCFVAGVPRSIYAPSPHQIIQTADYVVLLFERMSWRIIPLKPTAKHLPDNIRLWNGDSIGHWEGDTLVVETTNMNGKMWLNEVGDVTSYGATITERFTPISEKALNYRATFNDPVTTTRPFTIEIPLNRGNEELLEVACLEDNVDLHHLKEVRDKYRAEHKDGQPGPASK